MLVLCYFDLRCLFMVYWARTSVFKRLEGLFCVLVI